MISRIAALLKMKQPVPTDAGLLIASGATVPSDATLGYQTGCIFAHTDGAEGTALYVNEGSYTSSDFNAVASMTAAQEALLGATAGTAAASKALIFDGNVKIDRVGINLGSNHGVHVTTSTTGLTKNAFRAGDWGTELDIAAGYGSFRMYGKYSSGSGASTLGFVRALTESATIDVSAFQFYADCDAATPGPANVHAADFFAVVNTTKYLAAGSNLYDGLIATWHKITAPVGAVINGNAFAIFLDNQVNVTVAGVEAAILSMTGGSRPDAWAYFKTTSSGYDQLFTFDSTFNSGAGTCVTTDAVPGTQDARIKVYYNGTQYYLPLYR